VKKVKKVWEKTRTQASRQAKLNPAPPTAPKLAKLKAKNAVKVPKIAKLQSSNLIKK